MTGFEIEQHDFASREVELFAGLDARANNWPVVYTLDDDDRIYVGETGRASARMRQHLQHPERRSLTRMRIVLDDTFNKSVCLDLESFLIRYFDADTKFTVLNSNAGITEAQYYQRDAYQSTFDAIFTELRERGAFERTRPEIENSAMYKLSPFKALNVDQAAAVNYIVAALIEALETGGRTEFVVHGEPGTGKTIVAIYLLKLLGDIARLEDDVAVNDDAVHAQFFSPEARAALEHVRIGFVIPQQSLRASVKKVFAKTPGLSEAMVLSPFDVAEADADFDLLVVDEAHRLGLRAGQSSGPANARFAAATRRLFGSDDVSKTQLDWLRARSRNLLLLLDERQTVAPADLSAETVAALLARAREDDRLFRLHTQMRMDAPEEYLDYVRALLSGARPQPRGFGAYDLRFYDRLDRMADDIAAREEEHSLARLVAGFAWPWRSKHDRTAVDIDEPGLRRQWNRTATDWISSRTSPGEVGSIHTVQGYDLNYAGVIIGRDIRLDPASGRIVFDRSNYFDKRGKQNNGKLGITYSDDDLLRYVVNIYAVLMSRGIRGTYVYVCDEPLRERLRAYFPPAPE